jgi:hypothetical protein
MEPGAAKEIGKIIIVMPTNSSQRPTQSSVKGPRGQAKKAMIEPYSVSLSSFVPSTISAHQFIQLQ